jgi:hypothetical protein
MKKSETRKWTWLLRCGLLAIFWAAPLTPGTVWAANGESEAWLQRNQCTLLARISHFNGNRRDASQTAVFPPGKTQSRLAFQHATWQCDYELSPVKERPDAVDLRLHFRLLQGSAQQTGVSLDLEFANWSARNYVLLPGAVYNGNRFRVQRTPYPPLIKPADRRPDLPITINDLPHLNLSAGESRLEEFTGDLATPAVGFYCPGEQRAFWLLSDQQTRLGNAGLTVEESPDRSKGTIRITAPLVREMRPTINGLIPSSDSAATWNTGDEITLRARLYSFPASRLQALFDRFLEIRKDLTGLTAPRHMVPLSQVWEILEDKQNRENWNEGWGFYSLGARGTGEPMYSIWQLGWVGGIQNTLAFLLAGSEVSRQRAWRNLDIVLTRSQAQSGFFNGMGDGTRWYSDGFAKPFDGNMSLVRKNADALYFFLEQFLLLKKQGKQVPQAWEQAVRRQADAFVTLWKRRGQFGQFINVQSGDIVIGATTSAAMAPAGLALASRYYGNPEYLQVAEQAARLFYNRDVKAGVTTGGPAEALQAPDCESSYALLESFVVLYEITGKDEWLTAAKDQAAQFATWIVSYDYQFPPDTTFARLRMRTTGTCWANGQNKCSVPNICTASGDALLKLYRATGNARYLELLRDIVQAGPEYMSRADRPIPARTGGGKLANMEPGWIFERVQMGDWESPGVPIGETYHATASWCEAALTLTTTQIPGLYVQPDKGLVCAFDHIDARVLSHSGNRVTVRLTNPTKFPARVRTWVESSGNAHKPLGHNALFGRPSIELAAGEAKNVTFDARQGSGGFTP